MEDRKRQRQEISKLQDFAAVTNPETEEQGTPTYSDKRKVHPRERQQPREKTRGNPVHQDNDKRSGKPSGYSEHGKQKRKRSKGKGAQKKQNSRKDLAKEAGDGAPKHRYCKQTPDAKSHKGSRTRASGYRAWRWAGSPRGGRSASSGSPMGRSWVVRGGQRGGGREGGWERQRFPGS